MHCKLEGSEQVASEQKTQAKVKKSTDFWSHFHNPPQREAITTCSITSPLWSEYLLGDSEANATSWTFLVRFLREQNRMNAQFQKSLPAMSFRTLDGFRFESYHFYLQVFQKHYTQEKRHMRSGQAFTSSGRLPRGWLCGYVLCSVSESLQCQ